MTQQNGYRTVTEVAVVDVDVFEVYAIWRNPLFLAPFIDDRHMWSCSPTRGRGGRSRDPTANRSPARRSSSARFQNGY